MDSSASCCQSYELACICRCFPFLLFLCKKCSCFWIRLWRCLYFCCGSHALLPSQGLPWSLLLFPLSLTSLFSLSPSFLLSTFKCYSILKTSEVLWSRFSFSSQPRLYRIICSPPPFLCILCSSYFPPFSSSFPSVPLQTANTSLNIVDTSQIKPCLSVQHGHINPYLSWHASIPLAEAKWISLCSPGVPPPTFWLVFFCLLGSPLFLS